MNSEENLLRRARKFDTQALAEIYDVYSDEIYRYATRLLGDGDQAEDCVAETFHRFLKALSKGGGPRNYLRAYLYRIAHNWITDQYRRQPQEPLPAKLELHADSKSNPSDIVEESLEQERVRKALRKLTPNQRQVIVLRYLEGWNNEEIAKALNKPVGAVKSLRHRGVNSLRRVLKEG